MEIIFQPFFLKALIISFWLVTVFSLLGIFVLIKRMAFFSDGIAHASILGLAIGFLFNLNFLFWALTSGIFFALLIYFLEKRTKIHTDILIGIVFVSSLALGLILMTQKSNYQPELLNFLIGNILTLSDLDFYLTLIFSLLILTLLIFQFQKFLLVFLDETEAKLRKINVNFYEILFYLILAISIILGIKFIGVILVTAFLILPSASASLISSSFKHFIFWTLVFGFLSILGGFSLSLFYNFPLSASIVLSSSFLFFLLFILKSILK